MGEPEKNMSDLGVLLVYLWLLSYMQGGMDCSDLKNFLKTLYAKFLQIFGKLSFYQSHTVHTQRC